MVKSSDYDTAQSIASVAQNAPNEAVRNAIFALLHFAEKNAEEIRGGQADKGSFHYAIAVGNRIVNLFTCDTLGYVSIPFVNFAPPPFLKPMRHNRLLRRFRKRLAEIPGMDNVNKVHDKPGFLIAKTIVDPTNMSRFQSTVLDFQAGIDAL